MAASLRILTRPLRHGLTEISRRRWRAFDAMMDKKKIDVAAIKAVPRHVRG